MKVVYRFLLFISVVGTSLADRITIHNRTPRDLYSAIYYFGPDLPLISRLKKEKPKGILATPIQFLETESSAIMLRPARKIGFDRELVFVEDKNLLQQELTREDLKRYHSKNVGDLQGDVFYIGDKEAEYYGYTTVEWNVVAPILQNARASVIRQLTAINQNPYKDTPAIVRMGNELSESEKKYLHVRAPKVKVALEKLLGKSLDNKKIPTIAVVCSGGGYRAMLFTTGALLGADNAGILDTVTYMAGLSGSTWAIGGWVLSGKPIKNYHDWLINNVHYGLKNISGDDIRLIGDALLVKYFYDEPFDIVDLYGCLLANELFAPYGKYKQQQTLSSQIKRIEGGTLPFPIYTAIAAETITAENLWYEFTPYEVGASWLGMYVPSWAFGRNFKNGSSIGRKFKDGGTLTDFPPEQNFGVLLGTFGLAIGITLQRLALRVGIQEKIPSNFVKNIVNRILEEHGHKRITSSDFLNFTYGIDKSPVGMLRRLKLVDAGLNFNLPYPPVSGERPERQADIIIIVDASRGAFSHELSRAEQYAKNKKLKFPPIDYTNLDKKAVSVFKNENDPSVPMVIYITRILDHLMYNDPAYSALTKQFAHIKNFDIDACLQSGPCSTFNFVYTPEQAELLTSLGAFNMMAAKDAFIKAVEWKIDQISKAP